MRLATQPSSRATEGAPPPRTALARLRRARGRQAVPPPSVWAGPGLGRAWFELLPIRTALSSVSCASSVSSALAVSVSTGWESACY